MIRSAIRYQTAVVVIPPKLTAVKMYAAAKIDSVAPNIAKKTAPTPHVRAETRTASPGAPRAIRRSRSVGFRRCRSQAVLIAYRFLRTRIRIGTTTIANTASAVPPRHRSRSVASGLSRIGAAKDRKTKTIAPPDTLTNTAPQIQRLKVAYRRGSTGASAETLLSAESNRGGVVLADAKGMDLRLAAD